VLAILFFFCNMLERCVYGWMGLREGRDPTGGILYSIPFSARESAPDGVQAVEKKKANSKRTKVS
jgi:hypothetical protein